MLSTTSASKGYVRKSKKLVSVVFLSKEFTDRSYLSNVPVDNYVVALVALAEFFVLHHTSNSRSAAAAT